MFQTCHDMPWPSITSKRQLNPFASRRGHVCQVCKSYLWVQRETPQAAGLGAQTSSLPVRDSLCPPRSDVVVFPTKPWRWLSAEGRQTTWNSMPAGYHLASSLACWKSWITWFQTIELEKKNFIEAKWHSCSNWSQKTDGKSCPGCGCFYSTPRCLSKIRLRQCTLHLPVGGCPNF